MSARLRILIFDLMICSNVCVLCNCVFNIFFLFQLSDFLFLTVMAAKQPANFQKQGFTVLHWPRCVYWMAARSAHAHEVSHNALAIVKQTCQPNTIEFYTIFSYFVFRIFILEAGNWNLLLTCLFLSLPREF